jgi:hypothetical protein
MLKPLSNLPVLDTAALRESASAWKGLPGPPGSDRIVVEWGVMRGPNVFVFPAAKRSAGIELVTRASSTSDERWADYLESTFVPQVIAALKADRHRTQAICVDLRPIQIQRARRRTIEAAAHARTGRTIHLTGEDEVFNDSEIIR